MQTIRRMSTRFYLSLFGLVFTSSLFAAEQEVPQRYAWPWWHEGHGHSFWWIFPLLFFVIMVMMFVAMMRRGGMGCMWRDRMLDSSEIRDAIKAYRKDRPESAIEILDKRYARGEIDKKEYEEKKADIKQSD